MPAGEGPPAALARALGPHPRSPPRGRTVAPSSRLHGSCTARRSPPAGSLHRACSPRSSGAHRGPPGPPGAGARQGKVPLISGSLGSFHQVKHVDTEMTVATGNSHSWTPRREARHPLGALGEASRVGDVHRALTGFLGRKGAGIGLAHVGAAAVGAGLSQVSGICPGD